MSQKTFRKVWCDNGINEIARQMQDLNWGLAKAATRWVVWFKFILRVTNA
jgi:hypothetical protein